jgi:cytochrome P450
LLFFVPIYHVTDLLHRGILHNLEDYPDPKNFDPERYLTTDGVLDSSIRDLRTACFGFGRRVCPGPHIADASLFTTISTLLSTVDVVRAKDVQGKEVIPEVNVTSAHVCRPVPFPWPVHPRSQHTKEMLDASLAEH